MSKRTKQDYIKLLEETVRYYSTDVSRRSVSGSVCGYYIRGLDSKGHCCSVGRCIDKRKYSPVFELNNVEEFNGSNLPKLDSILKKRYRGFDIRFWIDIQKLHDDEANWQYEEGMTTKGKIAYNDIKQYINMGRYSS